MELMKKKLKNKFIPNYGKSQFIELEEALILFTKMESRIAVIETEVKNINKKLDNIKK